MEKPKKENYGYRKHDSFEDMPSGWIYEEGEEKYNEALEIWENKQAQLQHEQTKNFVENRVFNQIGNNF